jgi:4-carboxymuconolactone decarboxylase
MSDDLTLAPLRAEDWGDAEYDAYGSLLGIPGERVPRAGSGHRYDPLNFSVVGTFMHHPELAKHFLAFNNYQLQRGSLSVRWRELAILRVAHRRQSAYEWGQHVKMALDGHITSDEIDRVARGNEGFEGVDRLILEATDELLTDGRIGDALLRRINDSLDTRQVMDLVFIVGTYNMLAMAFDTWRLVPEAGTAPLPPLAEPA